VRCIFKNSGGKVIEHQSLDHSFLVDLPENVYLLKENYFVEAKGDEMVAMRPCRRIDIIPRDGYRYGWRFWVDHKVFLPLKIEMLDLEGHILEQVMFTQLALPQEIPFLTLSSQQNPSENEAQRQEDKQIQEQLPFVLNNIPAGFHKLLYSVKPLHDGTKQSVSHLLLSDGLARVSVYLDIADGSLGNSQTHLGSVHSVTRILGNKLLVVLGKVPAQTVEMIADGVELTRIFHQDAQ
jgi:sigma-E factor negative regulatory protein RseB